MTTRYWSTAPELIEKAHEALAQGDLLQASEKGWGAAAQITKAAANARGWPDNSHRLLIRANSRLVQETGDPRLGELFRSGSALHQNFYEQWADEVYVAGALESVAQYISKLEPLIQRNP